MGELDKFAIWQKSSEVIVFLEVNSNVFRVPQDNGERRFLADLLRTHQSAVDAGVFPSDDAASVLGEELHAQGFLIEFGVSSERHEFRLAPEGVASGLGVAHPITRASGERWSCANQRLHCV